MPRIGFLMLLSPSEKKALRILASIENKSMGEFTRSSIKELWNKYYPKYELGEIPSDYKRRVDNSHKKSDNDD
jgi:hypothetical protein